MTTFNRKAFEQQLGLVAGIYEKTAPTVDAWCDWLANAKDLEITLADLNLLNTLATDVPPANYAANMLYHLAERAGRDTTGHAGF